MTPEQALQVINSFREQATGPFTGKDHDLVARALQVIQQAIASLPKPDTKPSPAPVPQPPAEVIPMPTDKP